MEVLHTMIVQLFDMQFDCNNADVVYVQNTRYYGLTDNSNDLPAHCSSQDSTYGHIADAITSLGFGDLYEEFVCQRGERPSDEDISRAIEKLKK